MCWLPKSKTLLLCLNSSSNLKKQKKIKDNSWWHSTSGMSIILLSFWSLQFQSKTRNFKGFKLRPSERHRVTVVKTSRRKPIKMVFILLVAALAVLSPSNEPLHTAACLMGNTCSTLTHTALSALQSTEQQLWVSLSGLRRSALHSWRPEAGGLPPGRVLRLFPGARVSGLWQKSRACKTRRQGRMLMGLPVDEAGESCKDYSHSAAWFT